MRTNPRANAVATLVAALALLGGSTPLVAQATGSIRGTITNSTTGRPIADAQVFVAGTQRGTLSNAAGNYLILNVPVGEATVRVQMLGYAQVEQTVTVGSGDVASADFRISQSAIELNEIVVTGTPGATQKRALGNAISQIQAAEIVDAAPVSSVEELLVARTPGLTLMAGAGTAGTAANIRIRGAKSMNAGVQPIFYVDGVRIQSVLDGADFGVSGQDRSPLNHINPEDIESIEVIKGPAAATLYGAEAATGVIQIITKKGRTGSQDLSFSMKAETGTSEWHLEQPTSWKTCTASMITSSLWPGCHGMDPNSPVEQRILKLQTLSDKEQSITLGSGETVVIPQGLRQGQVESYNLSVRGGGERFSFFTSADHSFEKGVFFNNFFKRQSIRTNFQLVPNDKFEATMSFAYSRNNSQLPLNDNASNGLLRNAYRGEPGRTGAWAYGYLNLGPEQINTWENFADEERFLISTTMNYRPMTWLHNRLTLGLDKYDIGATETTPIDYTGRAPFGATRATGYIQQQQTTNHRWTVDYSGTAELDINDDFTTATSVGFQLQPRTYYQLWGDGEGFLNDRLKLLQSAAITSSWETYLQQTSLGVYVQEQVGWQNKLFLTAAVRVDDNSAFGQNFDLATYPKVSASYVMSDEDYFTLDFVDQLKLRAAWGKAGNAPAPFSADRTLQASTATPIDGPSVVAVETDDYGNPDLAAESGQELELGFDAGLFGNRAGLEFTYYNTKTKDALIDIPVPPSSGFNGTYLDNIGELKNTGVELALWGQPIVGENFVWDVRTSFSTNSNEVVSLNRDPILYGNFQIVQRDIEGYPLGGYWAWDVERDASGNPILDANGNATQNFADTAFIGPSTPTREIALTNTFTLFGNLRVFTFLDYKGGHYLWSAREWWRSRNQNISEWVNNPEIDAATQAAYRSGAPTMFIDRADFLKLREVSLTYSLPSAWVSQFNAKSASLQLSGRNLAVWSAYDFGSDPEVNFNGNASFTRSDYMSVPMMRRLSASIQLGF